MPTQTTSLFLLDDLEDVSKTRELAASDLDALRAVAIGSRRSWPGLTGISAALGPSVPSCLGRWSVRHSGWLLSRSPAGASPDVVQLMNGYKSLFLDAQPVDGDDANYKSISVVFTDLSADRAKACFDDIMERLGVPSYAEDGLVLGGFYESNQGSAIYNPSFRPFTAPVPFLLVRHAVISDWKFFLDNEPWLNLWARRFGESAIQALAQELRRLPWRANA